MAQEGVLAPDMDLIKTDEFYLFYEMMVQSLRTDNVKEGINKSLLLLRSFLDSGNIGLYMKSKEGNYILKDTDTPMSDISNNVGYIINKAHPLIEKRKAFNLDLNLSERLKKLMLLHIKLDDSDCVLAIINNDKKQLEPLFWDRVIDTMQIIIKRAVSYEKNTKAISIDLLTGLDNRNSYELKLKELDTNRDDLVLGIFDLFRLKYINDNFSHEKGDIYIQESANILNKYWPKERKIINESGIESLVKTGHCVYRVGGDEFILLTTSETLSIAAIKSNLASSEAELIQLGVKDEVSIGLNYGIVQHTPGDSIKTTYEKADKLMQENKEKMYSKSMIKRRD